MGEVIVRAEAPACAAELGIVAIANHVAVCLRSGFGGKARAAVALAALKFVSDSSRKVVLMQRHTERMIRMLRTVFEAKVLPVAAETGTGFDGHRVGAGGTGAVEDAGRVVDIAALVGESGGRRVRGAGRC